MAGYFKKRTVRDLPLHGDEVLVRADYNVPLEKSEGGKQRVANDYRIRQNVPTLKYLLKHKAKVVVCSHLGRPEGKEQKYSLRPVAAVLERLLGIEVAFAEDAVDDRTVLARRQLQPGQVLLLENVRFYKEEEANDRHFAERLAGKAKFFVQDGFGVVHRAHASTEGVTHFLPSVAGLLLEDEVEQITKAVEHPKKPLVSIVGGVKIHDKIELLENFIKKADTIIIGGAMANTFLVALGYRVGNSLYDKDEVEEASSVMRKAKQAEVEVFLPTKDVAVAPDTDEKSKRRVVPLEHVEADDMILDYGDETVTAMLEIVKGAGTILWNGPLGMIEVPAFQKGSEDLARFIAQRKLNCVVGGGDSAGFIDKLNLNDGFTHVSTGGGASLELMAGKKLPGIEALLDR